MNSIDWGTTFTLPPVDITKFSKEHNRGIKQWCYDRVGSYYTDWKLHIYKSSASTYNMDIFFLSEDARGKFIKLWIENIDLAIKPQFECSFYIYKLLSDEMNVSKIVNWLQTNIGIEYVDWQIYYIINTPVLTLRSEESRTLFKLTFQ